ncbi:hypothetical protein M426DRAFT_26145 [Hypoxylon sp. CI-4A]|nr:hypothetical protein M426DRAFT_26145 [Hypoxylon sp. CI-4A]
MLGLLTRILSATGTLSTEQAPGDPDFYNTVAEIYSGPACGNETFVWADPIFGLGGRCQPLDRNDNTPDILSYKPTSIYPECVGYGNGIRRQMYKDATGNLTLPGDQTRVRGGSETAIR